MSADSGLRFAPHLRGRPRHRPDTVRPARRSARRSGELQGHRTQCLAAHRHRQQHHLLLRPLRDGPGRVHLAADARRRGARRRPRAASRSNSRRPATSTTTTCSARRSPAAAPACAMAGRSCASAGATARALLVSAAADGMGRRPARLPRGRRRHHLAARQEAQVRRGGRGGRQTTRRRKTCRSRRPRISRSSAQAQKRLDTPSRWTAAPSTAST